jgi:hypothetical protein
MDFFFTLWYPKEEKLAKVSLAKVSLAKVSLKPKAIIAGPSKTQQPKKFIFIFIDNSDANISLFTLSCPDFNLGQLKVYKLKFAYQ